MLLEARDLTRRYGGFTAVEGLSFGIERGEIVGLLGPNGAGKTTTMRMLTGFLTPSAGSALVAGIDVHEDPRRALRHVGYMPESNPLYGEMRVREYLAFRAELKGVARRSRRRRIGRCLELCRIRPVAGQIIATLSKGYRQRVGLADAMLAEPDVLILDEPTIGLDPNQVRETRELIRALGESHTVLLSTHILAEAEAVCRRVLIIVGGRLAADDTPENLAARMLLGHVFAELKADPAGLVEALGRLDGVRDVERVGGTGGWHRFRLSARPDADVRPALAHLAAERGWPMRELTGRAASLEEVFQHITRSSDATAGRGAEVRA